MSNYETDYDGPEPTDADMQPDGDGHTPLNEVLGEIVEDAEDGHRAALFAIEGLKTENARLQAKNAALVDEVAQLQEHLAQTKMIYNAGTEQLRAEIERLQADVRKLRQKLSDFRFACNGLVKYRDRVGPLNFQLEKADDYIFLMRGSIAATKGEKP